MQIRIILIIITIMFLPKIVLTNDTGRKCKALGDDNAVDIYNSACSYWLNKENAYNLIQTRTFHEFMREEDCCTPLTVALYELLFNPNSFAFNSVIKIDSLFNAIAIEVTRFSTHGWIGEGQEELGACKTITIPKSLFSLLNETEQDSLYSIVSIDKFLSVTDSLLELYERNYKHDLFPTFDIIACSIRANIEQEPNGEYMFTLNNTRYRMIKLSDNHYVLHRKKEEPIE